MATATRSTAVARRSAIGSNLTTAAREAKGPLVAVGGAALGLAGGLALGSRAGRRTVLGVPLGRKSGLRRTVETLARATRELGVVTQHVSSTHDEIRQVREQLEKANRQSPLEVVLDGLTHRRGAHKRES
jgi:hypothetical protein